MAVLLDAVTFTEPKIMQHQKSILETRKNSQEPIRCNHTREFIHKLKLGAYLTANPQDDSSGEKAPKTHLDKVLLKMVSKQYF